MEDILILLPLQIWGGPLLGVRCKVRTVILCELCLMVNRRKRIMVLTVAVMS